jgi:hypothetical protein
MTTTCSVVAVPGAAVADGAGLGPAGVASCAIAMFPPRSSIVDAIKSFFIEMFEKWIFQNWWLVIGFAIGAKTRESGAGL